jgi:hypothetical protein
MILTGDGSWPFKVKMVGVLEVLNVTATWFGGDLDPQDKGNTACGYPTKGHPDLIGCALPMEFCSQSPSTKGSPIPRLPWGLLPTGQYNSGGACVMVWLTDKPDIMLPLVPVIDIGPAKSASTAVLGGEPRYFHTLQYFKRADLARRTGKPHAIDLTAAAFEKLGGKLSDGVLNVSYKVVT